MDIKTKSSNRIKNAVVFVYYMCIILCLRVVLFKLNV